jgi:predicted Zn-dependent protease
MSKHFSVGEIALALVALALGGFVSLQIAMSGPSKGTTSNTRRLTKRDSAHVQEQFVRNMGMLARRQKPPVWMTRLQLARMYDITARNEPEPELPSWVPDSIRAVMQEGRRGSYLEDLLEADSNVVRRWAPRTTPIRAWVQSHSNVKGFRSEFVEPARVAFTAWNDLALPVRFELVDDSTLAEVHVTWTDGFHRSNQIGSTVFLSYPENWIAFAHVELATGYDVYAIQNAARHEVGHVLGIGHSLVPSDMMTAESEGKQVYLTEADKKTVELWYRLPAGRIDRD